MIKQFIRYTFLFGLSTIILLGCKKEEELPQLLAGFNSTTLGLGLEDSQATAGLVLSRTDAAATTITFTITDEVNGTYGVEYTTEPAAVANVVTIEIPAGETSAELKVNKLKNPIPDEVISFNIAMNEVSNGGKPGTNNVLAVTFEETPVSLGAVMVAEVGGPEEPNQVFIDLSKQKATVVNKGSWDLAFSNDDQFRVILNYAAYTMARATDQTDLANVTDALVTDEYKDEMGYTLTNTEYMDDPTGDLANTAIAEISTTDNDNVVYVIKRGELDTEPATDRGFVKARITRDGDKYVITYGDINDADGFTSVTVSKGTDTHFTYFSFDNGIVDVAPAKDKWDFEMTTFLNEYYNYSDGLLYSYKYKDYSLTNYGSVKIARVSTDDFSYDDFSSDDLASITLEDNRLGIGSSWRVADFSNGYENVTYNVTTLLFYVIEDADGNRYKLKFTAMEDDNGDRGYPEFVYELL
ncbi:MAG: HmuY family protein [Cyclobacteriaceae bacterium]|nr:HmuY family protein [Cyclobacteriaceae bacterium]